MFVLPLYNEGICISLYEVICISLYINYALLPEVISVPRLDINSNVLWTGWKIHTYDYRLGSE